MNKNFTKPALLLLALLLGTMPLVASAGIKRTADGQPGSEQSSVRETKFDGIWIGHGSNLLIKQFEGYIIFQGKDSASTWQAKGVINGDRILCRGNGTTNNGDQFVYESTLILKDGILKDSWKVILPGGRENQGEDTFKRLEDKECEALRPDVLR